MHFFEKLITFWYNMEFLHILTPKREPPSFTLKIFEIFLENAYMYPKSILSLSYVAKTTMCGRLKQILE